MDDIKKCFMLKDGSCSGCIDMSNCGPNCSFFKTEEEQRAIEERIVERFKKIGFIGTYKSRLTGETLYPVKEGYLE